MAEPQFINPLQYNDPYFRNIINDSVTNRAKAMDPILDMNSDAFKFLTSFSNSQREREADAEQGNRDRKARADAERERMMYDATTKVLTTGYDIYKDDQNQKRREEEREEDRTAATDLQTQKDNAADRRAGYGTGTGNVAGPGSMNAADNASQVPPNYVERRDPVEAQTFTGDFDLSGGTSNWQSGDGVRLNTDSSDPNSF